MTLRAPTSSNPAWTASDLRRNPHAEEDKADRVRRMFAAIARGYDLNNRLHSFGRDQYWRRRAVELAEVAPGDRVLDVACGTGDLAEAFCDGRMTPSSVIGLDFTAEMLDLAREKAVRRRRKAGAPTPEYMQGDAMSLPFEAGSFEVVSIAFGIRNVARPEQALAEFWRVLAPGGRLIILEFSQPSNAVLRVLNDFYCNRVMPLTATLLAGVFCAEARRSGAYRYLPKSITTFSGGDRAGMTALLREAGFQDIDCCPLTMGVCAVYSARRPGR